MKEKMVRYTPETLPPPADRHRAARVARTTRQDDGIDDTDIPPMTDEQLQNAVRARFYKPIKRQITARVDADVLDWLKSQGKGYQSRINAILRREMLAARRPDVS